MAALWSSDDRVVLFATLRDASAARMVSVTARRAPRPQPLDDLRRFRRSGGHRFVVYSSGLISGRSEPPIGGLVVSRWTGPIPILLWRRSAWPVAGGLPCRRLPSCCSLCGFCSARAARCASDGLPQPFLRPTHGAISGDYSPFSRLLCSACPIPGALLRIWSLLALSRGWLRLSPHRRLAAWVRLQPPLMHLLLGQSEHRDPPTCPDLGSRPLSAGCPFGRSRRYLCDSFWIPFFRRAFLRRRGVPRAIRGSTPRPKSC